jgi:hypothetical protein
MGLDMYLYAADKPTNYLGDTGTEAIAYWRKHPDLHKYIVDTFNGGIDNGNPFVLTLPNLAQLMQAIRENGLAHNAEGFFWGRSPQKTGPDANTEAYLSQQATDINAVRHAVNMLRDNPGKLILYYGSW